MSATTAWAEQLEAHREAKDRYLRDHPDSPIPADERESFEGLSYFPPAPDYRVVARFTEADPKETVTVMTSTDGEREYVQWGEFRFSLRGEEQCLQAYRRDPDEERYWVPFRDETNGEESYEAGRYLDLDAEDRADDGTWVVDFNLAYSPFCAYSEAYECPLVPMENWLDARVEAGERVDG